MGTPLLFADRKSILHSLISLPLSFYNRNEDFICSVGGRGGGSGEPPGWQRGLLLLVPHAAVSALLLRPRPGRRRGRGNKTRQLPSCAPRLPAIRCCRL